MKKNIDCPFCGNSIGFWRAIAGASFTCQACGAHLKFSGFYYYASLFLGLSSGLVAWFFREILFFYLFVFWIFFDGFLKIRVFRVVILRGGDISRSLQKNQKQ